MPEELELFDTFCREALRIEDGSPLELYPEQRTMLADYFAGCRETMILQPKKSGKSTLLGALALFHLCTTRDAEALIGAASRDQAAILLRQAQGFVKRSDPLAARLQVKQREIVHRTLGGRIRVLAADQDTGDGQIPTLALVDELHRHKSSDLYGILRDGLGPRNGQLVSISTAGADQTAALWQMRQAAIDRGAERKGAYLRAGGDQFRLHEWSLSADDDLDDIELVATANPAPWQTVEALRERHDSPSMAPWQWARFACNIWTAGEEAWLPIGTWDRLAEQGASIPDHADVWGGIDLGLKSDSAALVFAWERPDGKLLTAAEIIVPPTDGSPLDVAALEHRVRLAARRYNIRAIAYDPWRFERSAQILGDEGLLLVEHPMTNERMCPASERLREAIIAERIVHDGDAALASHVNAGVPTETERGWRLTKRKAKDKIDALIGLLLAHAMAVEKPQLEPQPSSEIEEIPLRDLPGQEPEIRRGDLVLRGEKYIDRPADFGPRRGR